jgi:signal recognition particle receptor subunit beta
VLTSPDFVALVGALSLRALLFLSFRVAAAFLGRAVLLLVCFPLLSHNHAACEGAARPPTSFSGPKMSILDALPLPWYMCVGLSLFLLIPLAALALARGNEATECAPRGIGVFVLLAGPPGGGKTALQTRLCRGVALPPALLQPSASESRLRLRLRLRGDAVRATTLDVPGAPPFRPRALEVAALAQCACVVLVVDAAAPAAGGHFAQAADLLAALLAARAQPPPLLVAANKADAPGARALPAVRAALAAALAKHAGAAAAGDSAGARAEAALARATFVACSATGADGVEDVREFIEAQMPLAA